MLGSRNILGDFMGPSVVVEVVVEDAIGEMVVSSIIFQKMAMLNTSSTKNTF